MAVSLPDGEANLTSLLVRLVHLIQNLYICGEKKCLDLPKANGIGIDWGFGKFTHAMLNYHCMLGGELIQKKMTSEIRAQEFLRWSHLMPRTTSKTRVHVDVSFLPVQLYLTIKGLS